MVSARSGEDRPGLHEAVLACARSVLGPATVAAWTPLVSGDRSLVARAVLRTGSGRRSVVVKVPGAGSAWGTRERAALDVLGTLQVPGVVRLLAAGDDPPLLLLEDAGSGPSLADRLTGTDPDAAEAAVLRWAAAIGRLQRNTRTAGAAFARALSDLSPLGPPPLDTSQEVTAGAAATLTRVLSELHVSVSEAAAAELRSLGRRLQAPPGGEPDGGLWALAPGDTCPDNAVDGDGGVVLLDFEWAEYRHVAWEAAYLTVPWPTCWCSWRLPPHVVVAALDRWREALSPDPSTVAGLEVAVRQATTAWALVTSAWLLPLALAGDPPSGEPARPRPGRRALVQHRLAVAAAAGDGPLADLAGEALLATRRAWGDVPLPLAPAWS